MKFWHRWVVRENRNLTSIMLAIDTAWWSLVLLSHHDLLQRPHTVVHNST